MNSDRQAKLAAIFFGGLIAGSVDVGSASLINWLSPKVILQAIASGILGIRSFYCGAASALLGLILQWVMSFVIAAVFVLTAYGLPVLKRHWLLAGLFYGVLIFFIMNFLVVPLSAAPFNAQHFTAAKFVKNMLAMLLFGSIIAYCTHYFSGVNRRLRHD